MSRKELAADAALVLGAASVVTAAALVAPALAFLVGGLLLLGGGALGTFAVMRDDKPERPGVVVPMRRPGRRARRRLAREHKRINGGNPFNAETADTQ